MKMLITNCDCAPSALISGIVLQSKGTLACSLDRNIRMCHVSIKLRHMTKKLCRYRPPTDLGRCMLATPQHLNQVKSVTWKAGGGGEKIMTNFIASEFIVHHRTAGPLCCVLQWDPNHETCCTTIRWYWFIRAAIKVNLPAVEFLCPKSVDALWGTESRYAA
jgi:hypothetical protein